MLVEVLRLLLAVLLLVVLPGALMVNALLPPGRSRLGLATRAYLSVAGGLLLLMLVGVLLGFLPHDGRGHFQTMATGLPTVELAMLAVSALFAHVGVKRGAYAWLAARHPRIGAVVERWAGSGPPVETR